MRVECPVCAARGTIEDSRIPDSGMELTCPRCGAVFPVRPVRSGVDIIQKREQMVCPNCNSTQPLAESCAICNININEQLQSRVKQQERERLDFVRLRTEVRQVDAWYSNLFDRRVSSLLVRVFSLLILFGLFMTCSINSAKRNKFIAENSEEMRRNSEGSNKDNRSEKTDAIFRERFSLVIETVSGSIDSCFSQNYDYKIAWYQSGQEHSLTENMADNLNRMNRKRSEAATAFNSLPWPSKKYYNCYVKAKGLSNLHGDICKMANSYSVFYTDFSERLTNLNFEYKQIKDDLNACYDIIK